MYGFGPKFNKLLLKRLELSTFFLYYTNVYYFITYSTLFIKNFIKIINIILSQVSNVNTGLLKLKNLNILRHYLIKSYKGYCHSIGKPVNGQRTWSNAWTSFRNNNTLRSFISKTKQISLLRDNSINNKIDYKSIKKKYSNNKNNLSIKSKPNTKSTNKMWF